MSSGLRTWTATGLATLASAYALDGISAAAGALLVASQALEGLGLGGAAAFLAASYAAWGLALRPSLKANWRLLQQTGASTCLPSKIAHDLAARRGAGIRTRRRVTAAGYVGAELAKEAPYYLGAAGAALLAEGVTSAQAVVFLGGANLGAAAYELGLAQALGRLLARVPAPGYASFERDWDPRLYLRDYYAEVEPDERHTIGFLVEAARDLAPGRSALVFGAGPTLHHVFPFAARAGRIDLSDVLPGNLAEIAAWIAAEPRAHDWRPFVRHALACEGRAADAAAVARREAEARARIGRLLLSDLRAPQPLLGPCGGYDMVVTAYCADCATDDLAAWEGYMRRIAALARPGGALVVAALWRCRGYRVGGRTFPSANLEEADLRRALARVGTEARVEARRLPEQARHGYDGILLARCRLRGTCADRHA